MNKENLFITATRAKYRFPSNKGQLSVEDLWDLNLTALDGIYKTLKADQLKMSMESSLMGTRTKDFDDLSHKMDIVQHVFDTKNQEAAERRNQEAKKERRQKIMDIIAAKEAQQLQSLSLEELNKLLDD